MPSAYLRIDQTDDCADLNPAAVALFGSRTAAGLSGAAAAGLGANEEAAAALAATFRQARTEGAAEVEVVAATDDGPRLMHAALRAAAGGELVLRLEDRTGDVALSRSAPAPDLNAHAFREHPGAMLMVDPETAEIIDANHAAQILYGETRARLLAFGYAGLLDATAEEARAALRRACRAGGDRQRHRAADGGTRDVDVRCGPATTPREGTQHLAVVHDVSQHLRAERELLASVARLQRTVDGADDALFDWQPATDDSWISGRYERMLGFEPGELKMSYAEWRARVHPDDIDGVEEKLRRHMEHGEPYDAVFRMRRRDDRWLWMRARGRAYRDEDGEVSYFSGLVRDVHHEVEAEQAEARQRERVERQHDALLRLATDPAFAGEGLERGLARVTEEACAVLGCGRATVLLFDDGMRRLRSHDLYVAAEKRHFRGFEIDHERAPRYFAALTRERAIAVQDAWQDQRVSEFRGEYLRERAVAAMLDVPVRARGRMDGVLRLEEVDGPREWREDEVEFAIGLAGQVARLLVLDRERSAEAERLRIREQMLRAQELESLGRHAEGVAHEFNNMLLTVLGNADMALELVEADAPVRRQLTAIDAAARRSAKVCRRILTCSGRGAVLMQELDLSHEVRETAGLLRLAAGVDARLHFRLAPEPPPVLADAAQVRQLLVNLVTHACESAGESGREITVSTGVRRLDGAALREMPPYAAADAGDYVFVEVEDSGAGLDEEQQARLFEPFYTARDATRGLGMPAALGIVRGHGGAMDVRSAPGRGTAVQALLPQTPQTPQSSSGASGQQTQTRAAPPREDGKALRVLLVDDDEDALQPCAAMLDLVGYEVLSASNGMEALKIFSQAPREVDVVLLDLLMPRMDGHEAFDRLRAIRADVPIVITSGFTVDEIRERFAGRAMNGYLEKPYTLRKLTETLVRAVEEAGE